MTTLIGLCCIVARARTVLFVCFSPSLSPIESIVLDCFHIRSCPGLRGPAVDIRPLSGRILSYSVPSRLPYHRRGFVCKTRLQSPIVEFTLPTRVRSQAVPTTRHSGIIPCPARGTTLDSCFNSPIRECGDAYTIRAQEFDHRRQRQESVSKVVETVCVSYPDYRGNAERVLVKLWRR